MKNKNRKEHPKQFVRFLPVFLRNRKLRQCTPFQGEFATANSLETCSPEHVLVLVLLQKMFFEFTWRTALILLEYAVKS